VFPGRRTRPLAGARLVLLTACALLPALAGPVRAADDGPGALPWRVAGRLGFTVDAAAFPDSAGGQVLEVYVRIPPATLAGLARDTTGSGRLRVTARLRGAYGGGQTQERSEDFDLEAAESARGFGKVAALRLPSAPGRHRLAVRVEDLLYRRRIPIGRPPNSARIEGEVVTPGAEGGRALSDVEFVWSEETGTARTGFARGGHTLLPDPERLYGLFQDEMRIAFVARGAEGPGRPWHWKARVLDAAGQQVAVRESTGAAGAWLLGGAIVSLAGRPAGRYEVEVQAWQEGDASPLRRSAPFSVAWQASSWLRNPRDVEDDVHFLLDADTEEAFGSLSPGEQERFLDDFWLKRDPTPGTEANEARATFLSRVRYANEHWSHPGLGKGMFSDMGRVYIRYGEPSETITQVIPTGDETVDLMISQLSVNEDRAIGDVNMKGPGGDTRPFELWTYTGPIGLPPDADPAAAGRLRQKRLVFLFVDDSGTGNFRLRYSTE